MKESHYKWYMQWPYLIEVKNEVKLKGRSILIHYPTRTAIPEQLDYFKTGANQNLSSPYLKNRIMGGKDWSKKTGMKLIHFKKD